MNKQVPPIYKVYRQTKYKGNVLVRVSHSLTKFKQFTVENDKVHIDNVFGSNGKAQYYNPNIQKHS